MGKTVARNMSSYFGFINKLLLLHLLGFLLCHIVRCWGLWNIVIRIWTFDVIPKTPAPKKRRQEQRLMCEGNSSYKYENQLTDLKTMTNLYSFYKPKHLKGLVCTEILL
jgi:hypothetical protein